MLRVTPFYGSSRRRNEPDAPCCTLIEYAGIKVLVNVGWTMAQDAMIPADLEPDCVVLTDSTLQSMGGIPQWWWKRYHRGNDGVVSNEATTSGGATTTDTSPPLPSIPIYATLPTVKMGQMTLYDQHAALCMDGKQPPYTLEAVDDCIAHMTALKYSQHVRLQGGRLTLTAYAAGHTVGGAFFVVQRPHDDTVIVITSPKLNIAQERVLDRSPLLQTAASPDVLLVYPGYQPPLGRNALLHNNNTSSRSSAASRLTEAVLTVLRGDGHVLLPTDASGRCLEVLWQLHHQWEAQRLHATYQLVWFAPLAHNVYDFCRSQLEWMRLPFLDTSQHPLELASVTRITSATELDALLLKTNNNPTCVVASGLSLDAGPARDVLLRFAESSENAILFTDTSQCYLRSTLGMVDTQQNAGGGVAGAGEAGADSTATGTAAVATTHTIVDADIDDDDLVGVPVTTPSLWTAAAQLLHAKDDASVFVDVPVPVKVPLRGADLRAFTEREQAARQQQAAAREQRAMLAQVELAKGQLHLGEAETTATSTTASTAPTTTRPTTRRPRKKSRFDSDLLLRYSKPRHLTFDVLEEAVGIGQDQVIAKFGIGEANRNVLEDDYGISVQPEKFASILLSGGDTFHMNRGGANQAGNASTKDSSGARVVSEDEDGGDGAGGATEELLEVMDLSEGYGIIRGRNGRPPTKVITVLRKIEVLAEVSYIAGLEGRVSEGKARQAVRALQPREVIVMGGPSLNEGGKEDSVAALASTARMVATGSKNILTPTDGETVEISVGRPAFSVRLIDTPYHEGGEDDDVLPPPPVEVVESKLGVCTVSAVDCVATGDMVLANNSLVLAPKPPPSRKPSVYVSDGEVLLTDVRAELIAIGLSPEYSTAAGYSQLVVNQMIVVRKDNDSGRIHMEGPLCEDFYSVRAILCAQYLVV